MANNKNPNEKQPGEKSPGKYHYNPGNMAGKEAPVSPDEPELHDDADSREPSADER